MSKEVDNDFSVVSGNYESEVPSKRPIFQVVLHIKFHLKRPSMFDRSFL